MRCFTKTAVCIMLLCMLAVLPVLAQADNANDIRYVSTSLETNRLLVRPLKSFSREYRLKLFSGAEVSVLKDDGTWATVEITGTQGKTIQGYVKSAYLSKKVKKEATVSAVYFSSQDLVTDDNDKQVKRNPDLADGIQVTVIGSKDDLLCFRTMDGGLYTGLITCFETVDDSRNQTATVNTHRLRLRAEASKEADAMQTLHQGCRVTVLLQGDTWCQVLYSNVKGYMMTKFLKFEK